MTFRTIIYALLTTIVLAAAPVHAASVDINTAGPTELAAALTGVGAAKAAAIVKYRKANGPFKKVEDLAKVEGIGKSIIEQNRSVLAVAKAAKSPKTRQ